MEIVFNPLCFVFLSYGIGMMEKIASVYVPYCNDDNDAHTWPWVE